MRTSHISPIMHAWSLALLAMQLPACTKPHPALCDTNADCAAAVAAGSIPSEDTICDTLVNYCSPPCHRDEDCGPPLYFSGLICDVRILQCRVPGTVDAGTDGGADAGGVLPLGAACTASDGSECASGNCADGVCCDTACAGRCERCDLDTHEGECTPIADGEDPDDECPGHPNCGGTCDGARACRALTVGQTCDRSCDPAANAGAGALLISTCDAAGACNQTDTTSCAFARCTGEGLAASCPSLCEGHDGCVATSLCDRVEAHANGGGRCVPPSEIIATVTDAAALQTALDNATAESPFIKLQPGIYAVDLEIAKRAVLVGMGATPAPVVLNPGDLKGISLLEGAEVTVENLTVSNAAAAGIACNGGGTSAVVSLIETVIDGSTGPGLDAIKCDATVRRSTISNNDGGGLNLITGSFVVTNTLIVGNGKATDPGASLFGGVSFASTADVTFVNNTVVSNLAQGAAAGGVQCPAGISLVNAIIADNSNDETSLCTLATSVAAETKTAACTLDGNFRPTTAPCINSLGDDTAVTGLLFDRNNANRHQGSRVDLGAFEIR